MPTLGEQLRKARKAAGLTQRQLADAINAKHNSVSNWENDQNKPDPDTIELICGTLKISPSYLLAFDETEIDMGLIKSQVAEIAKAQDDKRVLRLLEYYNRLSDSKKDMIVDIAERLGVEE